MHDDTCQTFPEQPPRGPAAQAQPAEPENEFVAGLLRTGGVLCAFLVFGLGWSQWAAAGPAKLPPYPAGVSDEAPPKPTLWLVDGYNVVCTSLLGGRDREGWWQAERRGELLERLEGFDDPAAEIWVVFDGDAPPPPEGEAGRVRSVFAVDADAWLLEQVKARPDLAAVAVVTSDRKVADRARHKGAHVVAPRALLARCTG